MDGTDICWDPNDRVAEGVIANIGRNGNPPQLFPLQRCQGTCLQDTDCAEGLVSCLCEHQLVNRARSHADRTGMLLPFRSCQLSPRL